MKQIVTVRFLRPYTWDGGIANIGAEEDVPLSVAKTLEKTSPPTVMRIDREAVTDTQPAAVETVAEPTEPEAVYLVTDGTVAVPAAPEAALDDKPADDKTRPRGRG